MRADISRHGRVTGALGAAVALLLVAGVGATVPGARHARLSVSTAPATPAAGAAPAVNPVFRPLLPRLKGVGIPVRLPTYLPRQSAAGGPQLSATLDDLTPRSYLINLGFDPACHGATACRFGQLTGGPESDTPTAFDDPRKRQVRLRNGTRAFYYPYACGASCGDSTLVFQTKGVTYTVGLKAGSLTDVLAMANSVAPATAVTATATPSPATTGAPAAGHAIKTVFLIVLENHNWSSIKGNPSAPYINDTLLPMGAHAERYDNPPGNHPSEPNYLWLEAGTNFGIRNDNPPATNHQGTTMHLVTLLKNAGISWTSYQEDITGRDCPLTNSADGLYNPKHNPQVYFDDVTGTNNPHSAYCIAHERPYSEMATDLAHNTVARYNFITPNLCDDGHNACAPTNDSVKQIDAWLSRAVPTILGSRAYKSGGALFITWDEGEGSPASDGPIGLIVESPLAKAGYANAIPYTHGSTLRTVEEIFGVRPFLGDAARQTDLRDLFTAFP